ncbi:MAG: leucine-rich repeat protein [Eubacterium sp.]|nr:leucine-rich repeat protein [Eubacterium sp.]
MFGLSAKNVYAAETLPEQTDGVIRLTEDVNLTETAEFTDDVTIDLNGFSIAGPTSAYPTAVNVPSGTLTVKDSSEAQTGKITVSGDYASAVSGSVKLESGTISASGKSAYGVNVPKNGSAVINGGSIEVTGAEAIALNLPRGTAASLDGGTIKASCTGEDGVYGVYIGGASVTFTLLDGSVAAEGSSAKAVQLFGNNAKALVKGGTISVKGSESNGICSSPFLPTSAEISGGNILAEGNRANAIFADSSMSLSITGGVLTSVDSASVSVYDDNTIEISGGTITGKTYGVQLGTTSGSNTLNISGDVVISGETGSVSASRPLVNISGGYFNGKITGGVPAADSNYSVYNITGGYFTDPIEDSAFYNYELAKDYTASTYTDEVKANETNILFPSKKTLDGTEYNYTVRCKEGYVLMNIPYDRFYKAEVAGGIDAVSGATAKKSSNYGLAGGGYHNTEAVVGVVYPVYVQDLKTFSAAAEKTNAELITASEEESFDSYEALFAAPDYSYYVLSEEPANYKEVSISESGEFSFGEVKGDVKKASLDSAKLNLTDKHDDYVIETGAPDIAGDVKVNGVVITAGGKKYGMAHVVHIWKAGELGWNQSEEAFADISGKTVTNITFYTTAGVFSYDVTIEIPVYAEVKASFTDEKTLKFEGIPSDAANVKVVKALYEDKSSGQKVKVYLQNDKEDNPVNIGTDGTAAFSKSAEVDKEYMVFAIADNYKLSMVKAKYTSEQAEAAKAEEDARIVSDQIAEIPASDKLTVDDENKVKAARASYAALSDEAKAKVSAELKQALEAAEAKIAELKKTADSASTAAAPAQTQPAAPAKGAVIVSGNGKYQVTNPAANGKGTVTMIGLARKASSINVPATIKYNGVSYKVTAIGAKAFANNTKVKTIKIGKNVKKIGKQAFLNAKAAKKITILSKKLKAKSVGAKAFKGAGASKGAKLTVKVPKAKKKAYAKFLVKKGLSKKAKIK